jgi:hypothetical protein
VNVKLRVQKEPAESTGPLLQVLTVSVKLGELPVMPVTARLLIVAEAVPVFVTVTVCTALIWPTVVVGKVSEVAESVMLAVPGELVPELAPPPQPVRRERTETNATAKHVLQSMRRTGS